MEPAVGKLHLFFPTAKDVWDAVQDMYSDVENLRQNCENQDREIEMLQPTIMRL